MSETEADPEASKIDYHCILGQLGYTKTLAEKRVKVYKTAAENLTQFCRRSLEKDVDVVIAGSRGEGIAIGNESDFDMLYVQRCTMCVESGGSNTYPPVLFYLDFENVESGYTMLRLISIGYSRYEKRFIKSVKSGLVLRNGFQYLRNDQIIASAGSHRREGFARQQFVFDDTSGPARTLVCDLLFLNTLAIDRVLAFPCVLPSLLDTWCERKRLYGWPNKELIDKVKSQEVFVVPVGVRESVDEVLQWRLSLTLSEQALVHSFNDTQIKLYVAMKMLAKQDLQPVCKHISSYVVKNVIFWFFEETPVKKFTRAEFNDCLLLLLKRLEKYVKWIYLPNYMFPSRNMFKNKIYEKQREELLRRLDFIINKESHALQRCDLIKHTINLVKDTFIHKSVFLELAELMSLSIICIPPLQFKTLMDKKVINRSIFYLRIEEIAVIVFKYVLPVIRRYNPFGYFNPVLMMSDAEILRRLFEGKMLYVRNERMD